MIFVAGLATICAFLNLTKLLRIAQLDHYIRGSVLRTTSRWIEAWRTPNVLLILIWFVSILAMLQGGNWQQILISVSSLVGLLIPYKMLWQRSRRAPVLTPRLFRLGGTAALIIATLVLFIGVTVDWRIAFGLIHVLVIIGIELALFLTLPIESALSTKYVRRASQRLNEIRPMVIAITGSYGKTSTKEHARDLISQDRNTVASPASWNNRNGLARAVNEKLTVATEIFIAEMGTYGLGEIRDMCEWINPSIAVITAIGPVHLERMKTIDTIVRAKSEILDGPGKVAILNVDDPRLKGLAQSPPAGLGQIIRCSTDPATTAEVQLWSEGERTRVRIHGEDFAVEQLCEGVHPSNAALAVAIAISAGIPPSRVCSLIPRLRPTEHRAAPDVDGRGLLVVDDTFNSNPLGAEAALKQLLASDVVGRRVVVTPGMVELGPEQFRLNRDLAQHILDSGCWLVIVGRSNRRSLRAGSARGRDRVVEVDSRNSAVAWVRANLTGGDAVLWENDLPSHYP
jgi:UDP-N-acetylmuramoyl-tripeptide--D-alanyl-D-alanine ligase